ncbi:MAG: ABC transporter permease [Candidatus Cloacimonetes bacterium]|nr:ABC transporter permease [Candidatus Cloacimonadota bacterium]
MLFNIIKTAFRHLYKRKTFSLINIMGLAIGMSCCILILLWVSDELSYDRFHNDYQNIYRVAEEQKQGDDPFPVGVTPAPLGPGLVENFPEIQQSVRIQYNISGLIKYNETVFREKYIILADASFLDVFNFPLLKGDKYQALAEPASFVITESIARKYFGEEDPIGKTLNFEGTMDLTVTGVLADPPANSHLYFDMIAPFNILETLGYDIETSWGSNSYITYVKVAENVSFEALNEKIGSFLSEHDPGYYVRLHLQPLKDIHLKSNYTADWSGHGSQLYVKIFSIIAVFILLIACINFMNLSTAQSPLRAREIGIRKVVGANRSLLIQQFLGESLIIAIMALCIAVVIVEILLPYYNDFTGKSLNLKLTDNLGAYAGIVLIALISGIVAGSYPALVLSGFKPVKVLKGGLGSSKGGVLFRKILVVFQFTLSIALISSTLIIFKQINLIRTIDLGYNKDQIVKINQNSSLRPQFEAFKAELLSNPRVKSLTTASAKPTNIVSSGYGLSWADMPDSEERRHLVHTLNVGPGFFETFDIKIKEGRAFSSEISTDTLNYICNSEVLKIMDLAEPLGTGMSYYREEEGELIGIVEDFHFKSLRSRIEPLIISYAGENVHDQVFIRVQPGDMQPFMADLQILWEKYSDDYPFEYLFLDEYYNRLYNAEYRMSSLFNLFAILAILISCLGLFGLVSYTTACRTREIGIRKVMGASVGNILMLLSSRFLLLVVFSNILAGALSWYFMTKWLDNFAYRVNAGIMNFIYSGLIALGVALLTLSWHTIKAAAANPIKSIRYE